MEQKDIHKDVDVSNKRRNPCPQCFKYILEDHKFLTCHGCFEELHCSCFNDPIPTQAYDILKEELSSVFIFCPSCKAKLFTRNIFDKPDESCESRLGTLETQFSKLISALTESATSPSFKNLTITQKSLLNSTLPGRKTSNTINGASSNVERAMRPYTPNSSHYSKYSREERDFGMALSGHDQMRASRPGSRSPLDKPDYKPYSNSGNPKGMPAGSRNNYSRSSRKQPYNPPRQSGYAIDPEVASEALRPFCYKKSKNDESK